MFYYPGMAGAAALVPVVLHFVLIHGFCGGAWNFYKVKCLMEASGYRVTCIDLKSAGIDVTNPQTIRSFEDYNEPLLRFMKDLPDNEQVVLVGHSAGGLSVTLATHMFPKKIRMAVYLAATMLEFGFRNKEDRQIGIPERSDDDLYESEYGLEANQLHALVKKESQSNYSMTPPEDVALSQLLYKPGPLTAITGARFLHKSKKFERVERVYIKTAYDQVLKPHQQEAMIQRWPPSQVYTLNSDHFAPTSAPFQLIGVLIKATSSLNRFQ